jgi:branched-chain amino acid transport system substrate-binding protein
MKVRFLALVTVTVILGLLLSACGPAATPAPPVEEEQPVEEEAPAAEEEQPEVYKIGYVDGMTGDGAVWGQSGLKGATIAVEEINDAGGIDGVPIELVVEDNRMASADTLTAVKKLAEVDKLPAAFGISSSTICFAACGESEKYKMVLLTTTATNPGLGAECPDWFYRVMPSDAGQGIEMVRVLEHFGVTEAPIMYINNDYGIGVKDAFVAEMERKGYTVTLIQPFEWAATDFRTEILKVSELNPEYTVLVGYVKELGIIPKQATELGFETQFIIDVCGITKEVCEIAGEASEGLMGVYPGSRLTDEYKDYAAKFNERWGEPPTVWSEFSYDAVKLLSMAIEKGGYTSEGIKGALREVAKDYVGPSGPKAFQPDDNVVAPWFEWDIVENGKWVTYEP